MMNEKKKVLILGASRGQVGLYESAKKMGYTSVAASIQGDYPALRIADIVRFVDITNPAKVLEVAKSEKIDAVVTSCQDTGLEALALVAKELGLPGLSMRAARASTNKAFQKQLLLNGGVPTAKCREIYSIDSFLKVNGLFEYPIVIKRLNSQGSSGVFIVQNLKEALLTLKKILTEDDSVLVEEYIEGIEFGAQAFVFDGNVLFVVPHGDYILKKSSPVPFGHWLPYDRVSSEKVEAIVKAAIGAIGLNNCAVNVDIFLCKDGSLKIIELTGRAGSNGLPELMSKYFDQNYYDVILKNAFGMGSDFNIGCKDKACVVKMLLPKKEGLFRVNNNSSSSSLFDFRAFKDEGEKYQAFNSLKDAIGQISLQANTLEECDKRFYEIAQSVFMLGKEDVY